MNMEIYSTHSIQVFITQLTTCLIVSERVASIQGRENVSKFGQAVFCFLSTVARYITVHCHLYPDMKMGHRMEQRVDR
jgi:hypothetical protein